MLIGRRSESSSSSSVKSISTAAMLEVIEKLKMNQHRDSTQKGYYNIWKSFNEFFLRLDHKPNNWEDRIVLYVGYLIDTKKQSSTVKSYISAIWAVLQCGGVTLHEDSVQIASLVRACRLRNDKLKTRFPISKGILNVILNKLQKIFDTQPYLLALYQALFASAYYGLLRIGEVTQSPHVVKATDVHLGLNKRKLLFILRTSKTHGKGSKPQMVKISSSRPSNAKMVKNKDALISCKFCPYALLRAYITIRNDIVELNEQFFIFSDGTPVKPHHARTVLSNSLRQIGMRHNLYGFHSFRSGRSQDLLKAGLSVETIKKLGRWKSNSIYTYLS